MAEQLSTVSSPLPFVLMKHETKLPFRPVSIAFLAKLFGKSKVTIWRWIRTEGLPNPRKIGKEFYFDLDEVLVWWEQKGEEGQGIYQPE